MFRNIPEKAGCQQRALEIRKMKWIAFQEERKERWGYASSNSIFFAPGSSFTMRNLRIWPVRTGSGLAPAAGAAPFQRACSIEPREDKSGFERISEEDAGPA